MALTQEYMVAVSQSNILRVRIMLKDSLLVDTTFNQFNEMVDYAESMNLQLWLADSEEEGVLSDAPEELNLILAGLVNCFTKKRINHLKAMISKQFPPKVAHPPKSPSKVVGVMKIDMSGKKNIEYHNIVKNRKHIYDIMEKAKEKKYVDSDDIIEIRMAAERIIEHCNNIIRK